MAVGMICHHTKLDDGLRAGYAAIAIVTLTMQDNTFQGAVFRVISVMLGCLCAVLVNVVFDKISIGQSASKAEAHNTE